MQNTHTFGPHAVLTTRYGYTRLVNSQDLVSQNFDFRTLGFPDSLYQQVPYKYFPPTSIDGYASLGAGGAFLNADDGHAFQSTFLYVRGSHSLKIGEDIRVTRSNRGHTQSGATSGTYSFNAAFTQGPNPNVSSSTAGIGFASFLLGTPASGQIDNLAEGAFQGKYYGLFVQDDIRLTSSLTMNLGLRWDYESPLTERFNNMNRGFDFNAVSPVQPPGMTVKGGLVFADANHRSQGDGQPTNFAPRVGLAWRLGSHSALRAGYGIFYGSTGNGVASSAVQAGFSASTSFVSSLDGGITPANYLHDPFPQGLVKATGSTLGLATFAGQSVSFVSPHFIRPYTQNYTLNIQREFAGHILVDLGYAGLRGTHLSEPQALQLDQLPPADLSLGTQLQSQVNNPFFGLISIGPLSAPKIALQQLLRPFPQFTSVTMLNPRIGNSTYHSFQAKVEHRFSGGLSFLTSYTLSKLIDDLNQLVGRQDNYNLKAERSLSEYDRTHRLVTTVVWELPIGRGKRFLNQSAVVDRLLGGWQADTIYQIQSGRPLPLTATPTTTVFGGGLRPNNQRRLSSARWSR